MPSPGSSSRLGAHNIAPHNNPSHPHYRPTTSVSAGNAVQTLSHKLNLKANTAMISEAEASFRLVESVPEVKRICNSHALTAVCLAIAATRHGANKYCDAISKHSTLTKKQFNCARIIVQRVLEEKKNDGLSLEQVKIDRQALENQFGLRKNHVDNCLTIVENICGSQLQVYSRQQAPQTKRRRKGNDTGSDSDSDGTSQLPQHNIYLLKLGLDSNGRGVGEDEEGGEGEGTDETFESADEVRQSDDEEEIEKENLSAATQPTKQRVAPIPKRNLHHPDSSAIESTDTDEDPVRSTNTVPTRKWDVLIDEIRLTPRRKRTLEVANTAESNPLESDEPVAKRLRSGASPFGAKAASPARRRSFASGDRSPSASYPGRGKFLERFMGNAVSNAQSASPVKSPRGKRTASPTPVQPELRRSPRRKGGLDVAVTPSRKSRNGMDVDEADEPPPSATRRLQNRGLVREMKGDDEANLVLRIEDSESEPQNLSHSDSDVSVENANIRSTMIEDAQVSDIEITISSVQELEAEREGIAGFVTSSFVRKDATGEGRASSSEVDEKAIRDVAVIESGSNGEETGDDGLVIEIGCQDEDEMGEANVSIELDSSREEEEGAEQNEADGVKKSLLDVGSRMDIDEEVVPASSPGSGSDDEDLIPANKALLTSPMAARSPAKATYSSPKAPKNFPGFESEDDADDEDMNQQKAKSPRRKITRTVEKEQQRSLLVEEKNTGPRRSSRLSGAGVTETTPNPAHSKQRKVARSTNLFGRSGTSRQRSPDRMLDVAEASSSSPSKRRKEIANGTAHLGTSSPRKSPRLQEMVPARATRSSAKLSTTPQNVSQLSGKKSKGHVGETSGQRRSSRLAALDQSSAQKRVAAGQMTPKTPRQMTPKTVSAPGTGKVGNVKTIGRTAGKAGGGSTKEELLLDLAKKAENKLMGEEAEEAKKRLEYVKKMSGEPSMFRFNENAKTLKDIPEYVKYLSWKTNILKRIEKRIDQLQEAEMGSEEEAAKPSASVQAPTEMNDDTIKGYGGFGLMIDPVTDPLWRLSETTLVGEVDNDDELGPFATGSIVDAEDGDYIYTRKVAGGLGSLMSDPLASPATVGSKEVTTGGTATSRSKKKSGASKGPLVKINTTCCKYDIVRTCTKKCGFRNVEDMENWTLFWIDTGVSVQRVLEMYWEDLKLALKSKKAQTYIAKPDHGCQGKGIFLFRSLKAINPYKDANMIVQSYLPKPYLIDSLKFDLRIYVLVTSVDPLRIFIHKAGLARFATHKYCDPSDTNMGDVCMHLTNYAINKHSNSFIRGENDDRGSKRTLASVLKLIEERGGHQKAVNIWSRIEEVIVKTLLTITPQLGMILKACFPSSAVNKAGMGGEGKKSFKPRGVESQCFEILGFDIFLDSKLKPWVLEVNHSPSFTCDSPIDVKVKEAVIIDTLKMLDFSVSDRKRFLKAEKERQKTRLFGGGNQSYQRWSSESGLDPKTSAGPSSTATTFERKSETMASQIPKESTSATFNDTLDIQRPMSSASSTDSASLPADTKPTRAISAANLELVSQYFASFPPGYLESLKAYEEAHMGSFVRAFPPEENNRLAKYLKCLASARQVFADTKTTRQRREFLQKQKQKEDGERRTTRWRERTEARMRDSNIKPKYMEWAIKDKIRLYETKAMMPDNEGIGGYSTDRATDAMHSDKAMLRMSIASLDSKLREELEKRRQDEALRAAGVAGGSPGNEFSVMKGIEPSTAEPETHVGAKNIERREGENDTSADGGKTKA
ncbi:Tubulin polyglutamylase ttll6 [Phlyctochytrium bullatum]|nr:Tubulin polyglutamylase ttll6 [Phlyctochytrium bullatum]